MADHDHVLGPALVVEVAQPEVANNRQVPLENVMPVLSAGHGDIESALMPLLVDGVESRDRLIVGAVLQIARLDFVNAFDCRCLGG